MIWISANLPDLKPEIRKRIVAGTTLRSGGVSLPPYDSLNLATHVHDGLSQVMENRAELRDELQIKKQPYWLRQTHSTEALELPYEYRSTIAADASFTKLSHTVCVVMTADCLPLVVASECGKEVAAIHAGWRGLADGVIEQTLKRLSTPPSSFHVWLGPAISQKAFEVGEEVKQQFVDSDSNHEAAFIESTNDKKYMADLYLLARQKLERLGVKYISGGEHCTYSEEDKFFSYRRDGETGRMATMVWKV